MKKESDRDIVRVIGDFLELGHVENIVAMFKQDTQLYDLAAELLRDERYAVRLGIAVLFEELAGLRPGEVSLAIPSLLPLLEEDNPKLRGEAATILDIIGSRAVLVHLLKLEHDPDPQVREIIADIIHNSGTSALSGNEEYS